MTKHVPFRNEGAALKLPPGTLPPVPHTRREQPLHTYAGAYFSVVPYVCQGAFAAYPRQPKSRWLRYSTVPLTDPKRRVLPMSRLNNQCIFRSSFLLNICGKGGGHSTLFYFEATNLISTLFSIDASCLT